MAVEPLKYAYLDSPVGPIFILTSNKGLCRITINNETPEHRAQLEEQYKRKIILNKTALIKPIEVLDDYFHGNRREFKIKLDPDINNATLFQKRVWKILTKIRYGQVRSYQWVAHQLKLPHGARAVGAANRCNPLPIIIPCHRVINASGKLGGYSSGINIKKTLLELEGVNLT